MKRKVKKIYIEQDIFISDIFHSIVKTVKKERKEKKNPKKRQHTRIETEKKEKKNERGKEESQEKSNKTRIQTRIEKTDKKKKKEERKREKKRRKIKASSGDSNTMNPPSAVCLLSRPEAGGPNLIMVRGRSGRDKTVVVKVAGLVRKAGGCRL